LSPFSPVLLLSLFLCMKTQSFQYTHLHDESINHQPRTGQCIRSNKSCQVGRHPMQLPSHIVHHIPDHRQGMGQACVQLRLLLGALEVLARSQTARTQEYKLARIRVVNLRKIVLKQKVFHRHGGIFQPQLLFLSSSMFPWIFKKTTSSSSLVGSSTVMGKEVLGLTSSV
jgi:hypothetical protein